MPIQSMEGAEDEYYAAQTPAYRAANRPMSSVSELRAVAHMTPEIYRALLPWVTVWPQEPGDTEYQHGAGDGAAQHQCRQGSQSPQ